MESSPNEVLFLTLGDYRRPVTGGAKYSHEFLNLLSNKNVSVLSLYDYIYSENKYVRLIVSAFLMIFLRLPLPVVYFFSRGYKLAICSYLKNATSDCIVIIDHLELCYLIDDIQRESNAKIYHLSHNREVKIFEDKTAKGVVYLFSEFFAPYLEYEKRVLFKINKLFAISDTEANYYKMINPDLSVVVVPPVFSYEPVSESFDLGFASKVKISFLANFNWLPNIRALEWIVNSLCPVLSDCFEIHVFGKGAEKIFDSHGCPSNIVYHGFVDDVTDVFKTTFFTISPMSLGAGVNIKVCESLYNHVPVLVSPLSRDGIPDCYANGLVEVGLVADDWNSILVYYKNNTDDYFSLRNSIHYISSRDILI